MRILALQFFILFASISPVLAVLSEAEQQELDRQLIKAVQHSKHESITELLERGASPNAEVQLDVGLISEQTPIIFFTLRERDSEAFLILKQYGANLKASSSSTTALIPIPSVTTLFEGLLETEDVAFIRLLMPEMAVSKEQFHDGLMVASEFKDSEVFEHLLTVAKDYMRPQDAVSEKAIPDGMKLYIVKPGETLWFIARSRDLSTQDILDANPDLDEGSLSVGQRLYIPQKKDDSE